MWAHRSRLLAVLALVLVMLPLGAVGADRYFCRMAGRVMESCCCPAEKGSRVSSCTPAIEAEDCCHRLERANRDGAPALRDGAVQIPVAGITTVVAFVVTVPEETGSLIGRSPRQARAPPRAGPPLFLQNCSLLI